MFYNRSKKSGRDRRAARRRAAPERPSILEVKMRRSGGQSWNWRKAVAVAVSALALGAGLAVIWMTFQMISGALFWENRFFAVRDIRVECPGIEVARADILAFLPFRAGDNLFAAALPDARRVLLAKLPKLKDVELSRRLPSQLVVRARERTALARLKMEGYTLALDGEGRVMGGVDAARWLPLIAGHELASARPGMNLAGTRVMLALDVLSVCKDTAAGRYVTVVRVDLRAPDELNLLLADGTEVRLAWRQMQTRSSLARQYLEQKLLRLADIKRQGRAFKTLDMTLENNFPALPDQ